MRTRRRSTSRCRRSSADFASGHDGTDFDEQHAGEFASDLVWSSPRWASQSYRDIVVASDRPSVGGRFNR